MLRRLRMAGLLVALGLVIAPIGATLDAATAAPGRTSVTATAMTLIGADAPPGCVEVVLPNGSVKIVCNDTGDPGEPGDPGDGGSQVCRDGAQEVPCSSPYGWWNGQCYVRVMTPDPPDGDPIREGHAVGDGVVLECISFQCAQAGGDVTECPDYFPRWAPQAPNAGATPRELAERAVAQMNLTMGEIGSTPPTTAVKPAAMGVIGLPMWLWVANRAENTTGPITRTAADGGLSVSATGTLDRITWTLTEADTGIARATVTCRGENAAGTAYDGRDNASQSPTCGIPAALNQNAGRFTLTATAHWTVEWQGGGQSGTINVPPQTNNVPVTIGELQVLLSH